jgi:hypothetical protein
MLDKCNRNCVLHQENDVLKSFFKAILNTRTESPDFKPNTSSNIIFLIYKSILLDKIRLLVQKSMFLSKVIPKINFIFPT